LHRKLLNIASEISPKKVETSEYFKGVVSGDTIGAAHKNKPVFYFKPYARLVFAMNRIPQVKDNSYGFYRRFVIVPFNRSFKGKQADKQLASKLLTELDGIFLWALEGLDRLCQNDEFTQPTIGKEMIRDYQRANNTIVAFVEDCCELDPEASTEKQDLYMAYKQYCADYGYSALADISFFKELYAQYPKLEPVRLGPRTARQHHVKGIKSGGKG
jgi:putative DNA primase/helicase